MLLRGRYYLELKFYIEEHGEEYTACVEFDVEKQNKENQFVGGTQKEMQLLIGRDWLYEAELQRCGHV